MSEQITYRLETILIKNLSLEIPENVVTPTFNEKPEVQLEIRNKTRPLSRENYHEVVLEATARIKSGDTLQILIEVQQAGIFYLEPTADQARQEFLGIHAPNMLYPYLTRLIGDLMTEANAPRIFLPPFNFAVAYKKKQEMMRKTLEREDDSGKHTPS